MYCSCLQTSLILNPSCKHVVHMFMWPVVVWQNGGKQEGCFAQVCSETCEWGEALTSKRQVHYVIVPFLILSHSGNHAVHSKLCAELHSMGATQVGVVYGFKYGRDYHKGKPIKSNGLVHSSVLHRWFPKLQQTLAHTPKRITHVFYLEADAVFDMSGKSLCDLVNAMPARYDVAWYGWRNIWRYDSKWAYYYKTKFMVEGSHGLGLRGKGLKLMFAASKECSTYRHLDVLLSQRLCGKFYLPKVPQICTRGHDSVIFGKTVPKFRKGTQRLVRKKDRTVLLSPVGQTQSWIGNNHHRKPPPIATCYLCVFGMFVLATKHKQVQYVTCVFLHYRQATSKYNMLPVFFSCTRRTPLASTICYLYFSCTYRKPLASTICYLRFFAHAERHNQVQYFTCDVVRLHNSKPQTSTICYLCFLLPQPRSMYNMLPVFCVIAQEANLKYNMLPVFLCACTEASHTQVQYVTCDFVCLHRSTPHTSSIYYLWLCFLAETTNHKHMQFVTCVFCLCVQTTSHKHVQ